MEGEKGERKSFSERHKLGATHDGRWSSSAAKKAHLLTSRWDRRREREGGKRNISVYKPREKKEEHL